jgi:hypothetical protein
MSNTSRRRFLGVAGAGAAAAGVSVAVPGAASAAVTPRSGVAGREPVVAYVEDAPSGRVTLMVGEREVVVHDPDLVRRLLDAAGR